MGCGAMQIAVPRCQAAARRPPRNTVSDVAGIRGDFPQPGGHAMATERPRHSLGVATCSPSLNVGGRLAPRRVRLREPVDALAKALQSGRARLSVPQRWARVCGGVEPVGGPTLNRRGLTGRGAVARALVRIWSSRRLFRIRPHVYCAALQALPHEGRRRPHARLRLASGTLACRRFAIFLCLLCPQEHTAAAAVAGVQQDRRICTLHSSPIGS